jgi:hypothetical protein
VTRLETGLLFTSIASCDARAFPTTVEASKYAVWPKKNQPVYALIVFCVVHVLPSGDDCTRNVTGASLSPTPFVVSVMEQAITDTAEANCILTHSFDPPVGLPLDSQKVLVLLSNAFAAVLPPFVLDALAVPPDVLMAIIVES